MVYWQIILYIISTGMFFSLLSMGFGFTLRSVKFFNVAYGGAFMVGGYAMFLFYRTLLTPFFPALLISIIFSGLYLLFSYQFIFSPLIRRKANNFVLLIASFGILTATSAILGMVFGSQSTLIARRLSDIYTIDIFGGTLNLVQVMDIIFIPIFICFFAYVRFKTRFGRATRAIEDDVEVAELVGIPKNKTILKIFFIGGVLAGLGGIAEGFDVGIIPVSGLLFMFPIIVATIIGGVRSFWGGILGGFLLAIVQQLTIVFFGGTWVQAVPFFILIVILLVRPQGVLERQK